VSAPPAEHVRAQTSRPSASDAVSRAARSKLDAYLDLLEKWNRVYNLTAIRSRREMQPLHVEDALAVLPWLPERAGLRVLDVGSGGGVPGIPLAIARPDAQFTLVDSNGKKTAFLSQAAIELGLANVHVVTSRVEALEPGARFDVVIARAFSDLATFAAVAAPLLADEGLIVAMKGMLPLVEIAAVPPDVIVVATPALAVPGVDGERHLVIMEKRIRT
jgi:16S rRNA (guanine527-N7)-methyltransferase